MTTLQEVTDSYAAATSASVYIIGVEADPVEHLASLHLYFKRRARDADDELSREADTVLRQVRWRLMTNVIPYSSEPLELPAAASALDALGEAAGPTTEFGTRCLESATLIRGLALEVNPLQDAVVELLLDAPAGQHALVTLSRLVPETERLLSGIAAGTTVLRPNALRDCPIVETMVCVGPPRLFPAALRTAARADSVCFVEFGFEHSSTRDGGLFEKDGSLQTPVIRTSGLLASQPRDLEPFDAREEARESFRRVASGRVEGTGEPLEAVLVLLADGYAVWTEADDHNGLQCLDMSDGRPRLLSKRVGALAPDDFLILRVGAAEPDYIKTTADLFGAAQLRQTQDEWKQALRRAVGAAGGIRWAQPELERLGVRARNLRYWMGTQCISPRSPSDFLGLARFSGTDPGHAREQWAQLQKIQAAHRRAGLFVRSELETRILEVGVETLLTTGHQRYEIEHCGQLDAFRVVEVDLASVREVPASTIDRPFRVPESAWHG